MLLILRTRKFHCLQIAEGKRVSKYVLDLCDIVSVRSNVITRQFSGYGFSDRLLRFLDKNTEFQFIVPVSLFFMKGLDVMTTISFFLVDASLFAYI